MFQDMFLICVFSITFPFVQSVAVVILFRRSARYAHAAQHYLDQWFYSDNIPAV